jgi:hypothetical protein
MRLCLLLLALLVGPLTACAAEPVYEPVEVSVPVAVPCQVPDVQKPVWKLQNTPADAPLFDKVKAALIELDQRKSYETKLEAALRACR